MPDRRFRVGVVEKNQASYWDMVNAGWEDASGLLDLDIDVRAPKSEDVAAQRQLMIEFLDEGVDALAFVGTVEREFDDICMRARESGALVATFDLDSAQDFRSVFVGMLDPDLIGRRLGEVIAKSVPPRSTVLIQAGSAYARGAVGKLRGLRASLLDAGIEVVVSEPDGEDLTKAREIARDLISSHPDAIAVVGVYGYHPLVLSEALVYAGADCELFGFDMLPETVELLSTGRMAASLWIREYEFGYFTAVAISNLLRLDSAQVLGMYAGVASGGGRSMELEPILYTDENVGSFLAWSAERNLARRTSHLVPQSL